MGSPRSEASTSVPSSLQAVLLDHSYGAVKIEDIKKEVNTKDGEVENTSEKSSDVPLVTVKVEALEDMKIENGDKMENPVEVFLVEPKTEVKEESDDDQDPMMAEVAGIHENLGQEEGVRGKKRKRRSGDETKAVHNKEKPYQCEHQTCDAKFSCKVNRLAHYRSKHGLEKLKCQEGNCDKEFTTQYCLIQHIKKVHYKEERKKPHQCEHQGCGAKFANKEDRLDHYRSKHGLEKLKCQEGNCDKEFTSQAGRIQHIKKVHNKEERKKPHQCEHQGCVEKFTTKEYLLAHYRSKHGLEKLKCQEGNCDKEFNGQQNLNQHIKTAHNKEKPHESKQLEAEQRKQLLVHDRSEHGLAN